MQHLNLFISKNDASKIKLVEENSQILPGEQILISSPNMFTKESNTVQMEIFNPFNLIILSHYFTKETPSELKLDFSQNMPSGHYFIRATNFEFENSLAADTEIADQISNQEYFSFYFAGKFATNKWLLTYAVNIPSIKGIDVRIAIPKENFPYIMIDNFEGRPFNDITTDVWSNWLVHQIKTDNLQSVMFGYRSWIYTNYIIHDIDLLSKENKLENFDVTEYLASEIGIECDYDHLIAFSKRIRAKTVLGIVHQIIELVHSHVKFIEQKGEFGAKFALLNRQGDCTEYSALFTALCRIKNIPSRLVAGFKLSSDQNDWIRHAWSEFYYNGHWIPVDVVEGYIIGNHPDIIPLFKGNWMEENMMREVKISILPEFRHGLSQFDLSQIYQNLNISYKIQKIDSSGIEQSSSSNERASYNLNCIFTHHQDAGSYAEVEFTPPPSIKEILIYVYYKQLGKAGFTSPKIVVKTKSVTVSNKTSNLTIKYPTPKFPAKYEQGLFICSKFGRFIAWEKAPVDVK